MASLAPACGARFANRAGLHADNMGVGMTQPAVRDNETKRLNRDGSFPRFRKRPNSGYPGRSHVGDAGWTRRTCSPVNRRRIPRFSTVYGILLLL